MEKKTKIKRIATFSPHLTSPYSISNYCGNCGESVSLSEHFCHQCGYELIGEEPITYKEGQSPRDIAKKYLNLLEEVNNNGKKTD